MRPGATLGDVGHAIQAHAERHRCSVVRDYCGHGIGRVFHDAPSVLHFGNPGEGLVLRPGMIFTIEPMVNAGTWQVKLKRDGWTVITRDRQLSAQFEHTVGVTDDGREVFTISPAGKHHPAWSSAHNDGAPHRTCRRRPALTAARRSSSPKPFLHRGLVAGLWRPSPTHPHRSARRPTRRLQRRPIESAAPHAVVPSPTWPALAAAGPNLPPQA